MVAAHQIREKSYEKPRTYQEDITQQLECSEKVLTQPKYSISLQQDTENGGQLISTHLTALGMHSAECIHSALLNQQFNATELFQL